MATATEGNTSENEQAMQELEPFVLSADGGRATLVTPFLKVGGGLLAAGAAIALGEGMAQAQAEEPQADPANSPYTVQIESGGSVWDSMTKDRFSPQEIVADLERQGITAAEAKHLMVPTGSSWTVDPETVRDRDARLAGSVTITLEKGDTFYKGLESMEIAEYTEAILGYNGLSLEDAKKAMPGDSIIVPASYLDNSVSDDPAVTTPVETLAPAATEIAPQTDMRVKLVVLEQGENFYKKLADEGFGFAEATQIIEANSVDPGVNDLPPGATLIVPTSFLPPIETITAQEAPSQPPLPVESQAAVDALPPAVEPAPAPATTEAAPAELPAPVPLPPPPADAVPMNPPAETVPAEPVIVAANEVAPAVPEIPEVPNVSLINTLIEIRPTYGNETVDIGNLGRYVEGNFGHATSAEGISEEAAAMLYQLPGRQEGFDYTVNPATCVSEGYASAPMMAFIIAVQDYARQLTIHDDRFKEFAGFEFDIGDIISGHHNTHTESTAVDLRSRPDGAGPEQWPDGPLFVSQSGYPLEFTQEVIAFAHRLTYDGERMLDHAEITSKEIEKNLTGRSAKGDWIANISGHGDHVHFKLRDIFKVPFANPNNGALACDDPVTGGISDALWPYEPPVVEPVPEPVIEAVPEPVAEPAPVEVPPVSELPPPSYWQLAPNASEIITSNIENPEKREFMIFLTSYLQLKSNEGAQVNLPSVAAQGFVESSGGTSELATEANNLFGLKVTDEWIEKYPDKVYWVYDDELDKHGNPKKSAFKKFDSWEESVDEYIATITNPEKYWYSDAVRCRFSNEDYLNALIHELRDDCSIGRRQGEDGVASYATNEAYVSVLLGVINDRRLNEIFITPSTATVIEGQVAA